MTAPLVMGPAPRIALVKLGALGDGLYAFPLVTALKAFRPAAHITWIIETRLADLPRLHPAVDRVITVDTRGWRADLRSGRWGRAWRGPADFRREAAGRFDIAVDAQGLLKSGVAAWLTRAPVRVGFSPAECRERGNAWMMTHHAPPAGRMHAVDKNLGLAAVWGAPRVDASFAWAIAPADDGWAERWLAKAGLGSTRWVAMHPGAGHRVKRWGLDRWASLAGRVGKDLHTGVVLIAGPDERAAVAALSGAVVVAVPPSIGALAALMRRADLVVGGDTGPLHLAAAMGRPTIALYGPSDPLTARPVGDGHRVIKHPCACGWVPEPTFNRRCPDAPCMAAITVDEVYEAIEEQLIAHRKIWPAL